MVLQIWPGRGPIILKTDTAKRRIRAHAFKLGEGFVVLADSTAAIEEVPSLAEHIPHAVNLRKVLQEQGVLAKEGTSLRVTQDFVFGSPSTAASVLLGRSANGRTAWVDENGRTLKDIQEEAAAEQPR